MALVAARHAVPCCPIADQIPFVQPKMWDTLSFGKESAPASFTLSGGDQEGFPSLN
jgi:hypothetical protein